jgi:hypothetical protein
MKTVTGANIIIPKKSENIILFSPFFNFYYLRKEKMKSEFKNLEK